MLADPLSSYTSHDRRGHRGQAVHLRMDGVDDPVTPDNRYFVVKGKLW
jgi:hypothetical protein